METGFSIEIIDFLLWTPMDLSDSAIFSSSTGTGSLIDFLLSYLIEVVETFLLVFY